MTRGVTRVLAALLVVLTASAGMVTAVWWLNLDDEGPPKGEAASSVDRATALAAADALSRGAYLANAGNCSGCHTAADGVPYAGGRDIPTPFGKIYASNLTPDPASGIGAWSGDDFWRALHNGRSRDGRLLYPAFPYPNYTRVTRDDADAIFGYLRSLPAVARTNRTHDLSFPFDQQAALAVWRALYFRAGLANFDPGRDAQWNRGAYLVEGLGHCNACHASRNAFGAASSTLDLAGGLIPVQNWYAPSLTAPDEASVADWDTQHVVALLRTGVSSRGAVMGPMREVVRGSTQHLSETDLRAMAIYLKALPPSKGVAPPAPDPTQRTAAPGPGERLYAKHCAQCHGDSGEGAPGIYPALAGSRAVTMRVSANLVHVVLEGGFPPSTEGNPRPFGMPPFATVLSSEDVAQLLSYIRLSWGNRAPEVSALDVNRFRTRR